jgi:hypothetical protein
MSKRKEEKRNLENIIEHVKMFGVNYPESHFS